MPKLKTYKLVAGVTSPLAISGDYLRLVDAVANVDVEFVDSNDDSTTAIKGIGLHVGEYRGLRLRSAVDQDVTMYIGYGVADDSRATPAVDALVTPPGVFGTVPDVTVLDGATDMILASDDKRDHCVIVADGSNALDVRIGDANVGAARGLKLGPEQSATFSGSDAVYVYNGTGTSAVFQIFTAGHS
jgi:hypothetical protein